MMGSAFAAMLAATTLTPGNFVESLERAKAGEEFRLPAGTYTVSKPFAVAAPVTIVGEDGAIVSIQCYNARLPKETDANGLVFKEKVSLKNIRFGGGVISADRIWGGGLVRLEGNAAGSTIENCAWIANDIRMTTSGCYGRIMDEKKRQTSVNKPRGVLASTPNAGALVIDLKDRAGKVTIRNSTFAYNITSFGWTAGLNVQSGRVAVDGCTFWGNVINRRWGYFADLVVGFRGEATLANTLFAEKGGRFFDANDPLVKVGEGMKYGDPKFETTKEEFLEKYVVTHPEIVTLTAETFPFADAGEERFDDCKLPQREWPFVGFKKDADRTAIKAVPTAKVPAQKSEPNAFAKWDKVLKPGPVAAGQYQNLLHWQVHYEFNPQKYGPTQMSAKRPVYWFRHFDDPKWGRTYDFSLGKGAELTPDWFGVMKPVDGDHAGRPLVVALHGRGGGAKGFCAIALGSKDSVYNVPEDAYGLTLDCRENALNDFWWGAMPPATKEAGMKIGGLLCNWSQAYANFINGAAMMGELNVGPTDEPFKYHTMSCLEWCHKGEPPVVKRVLETIEWACLKYGIDRNCIYLVGNSMGGQGALAIGLTHGEIFAAINANVPATIWYPCSRLGFVDVHGKDVDAAGYTWNFADPPVVVDWSGSDDAWSRDHDVMYRNMDRFKLQYMGWWGPYGHCGSVKKVREVNPDALSFDIFSVKKNEAYPVFSAASANSALPWPQKSWAAADGTGGKSVGGVETAKGKIVPRDGSDLVGQWNGHLRWEVVEDTKKAFRVRLWTDNGAKITADVSMRRLQAFDQTKGGRWSFGGKSGKLDYNARLRTATVPQLAITGEKEELRLW